MWNMTAVSSFLLTLVLAGCAAVDSTAAPANGAAAPTTAAATRWVDAWGASFLPTTVNGTLQNVPTFDRQTLRFIVFSNLAGAQARVKFTNQFETTPLLIGAAHLALAAQGSAIVPQSDRALTFEGKTSLTLVPGAEVWSDPVTLDVPQHANVAISLYLPESRKPTAFHPTALKTSYLSAPGDFTAATTFAAPGSAPASAFPGRGGANPRTTDQLFFVSGLQVMAPARTRVIVAFGDSITDGAASTVNSNTSWPALLSQRLPALADGTPVSVINMGIGSNRLVSADAAGPAGVKRLAADVLARPNVTHLIVLEGINDISYEQAPPEQLIKADQDIIAAAHAKGIKVFGATLLPIQNSRKDTPENEATRQAVNKWIRESNAFDGVVDFEKVVQDPANPLRIRANLTGDYVHPNSTGYRLMAQAIDLKAFQ